LDCFFSPRSIAIIGASKDPRKGGYVILQNVKKGFKGEIFPVNPKYREIEGQRCYCSISEIPDGVDLAIIFVPAPEACRAAEELGKKGTKGIIVESGGFAESGGKGKELQKKLEEISHRYNMKLWGPNCMGLVDTHRGYVFSFVSPSIWEYMYPGNIALIVQSGMLSAGFLIDVLSTARAGISRACSIGNRAGITECDLLEYLFHDDSTSVIALYLESLISPSRFLDLCRNSPKPVVILKGGRTPQGAKAALTHTASMAQDSDVVSGIFEQANVIEVRDFDSLINISHTLACYKDLPLPPSLTPPVGTAIITYSGGAGIVNSDLLEGTSLSLWELSPSTIQKLRPIYPHWMSISNPLDVWPAVEKSGRDVVYAHCMDTLSKDSNIKAIFLHLFTSSRFGEMDLSPIKEFVHTQHCPIFIWLIGEREYLQKYQWRAREMGIPLFSSLRDAVSCADALFKYKIKQRALLEIKGEADPPPCVDLIEVPRGEDGILNEYEAKRILRPLGIHVPRERIISSPHEGLSFAEKVGYPVILKGLKKGVVHKSEAKLVERDICSAESLINSFKSLKRRIGGDGDLLIQEQVPVEMEFICGALNRDGFGTLVMFGCGGILAELFSEKMLRVFPFGPRQCLFFLQEFRHQHLLEGFRNISSVDKTELSSILLSLGALCYNHPEIKEVEINPLVLSRGRLIAVDATIVTSSPLFHGENSP